MPNPSLHPAQIRAELQTKREELRAQIADLTRPQEGGATIGFGKRIGEGTTQAIQQMADASTAQTLADVLDQVERSLSKLDEGSYGQCDVCRAPIGEARLEFRPWSVRCVEHADG